MAKILIIEDDATLRAALSQYLKVSGFFVETAENGFAALEKIRDSAFDLIVSDIRMPGLDGVTTVTKIKESYPAVKTILITGYSDDEPLVRALNMGVDAILKKPFGMRDLLHTVSVKLDEKEKEEAKQDENRRVRNTLAKIAETVPAEILQTGLGQNFRLAVEHQDAERIAALIEVGRLAEMRREIEASILAYEKALSLLAGFSYEREESPVRLALSRLFAQKNEFETAIAHALEALNLSQRASDPGFIIDARLQLAKLFYFIDSAKAFSHLSEAQVLLDEQIQKEKQAGACLLFACFSFRKKEFEKCAYYFSKFTALGRRHFLPQALVALQDIALMPLLLTMTGHPDQENLLWVLEEAAPFLQSKLKEFAKLKPSLSPVITPLLISERTSREPIVKIFGFGALRMLMRHGPLPQEQWNTSKGLSLFLLLFHEHPNFVSEERILDIFWPKIDLEKGRHTLRTTLYLIRRALGHETARKLIYNEKQKFGIRSDAACFCDYLAFRKSHLEAKDLWKDGQIDRAVFFLKESDALYKETFLQGWSDPWVLTARDRYKEAFLWNTMILAGYSKKQNVWNETLAHAQRALTLDPALEEAHCLVMESLLALGRRDDAVKHFHLSKDAMKNELALGPSERLRKLYWRAVEEKRTVEIG